MSLSKCENCNGTGRVKVPPPPAPGKKFDKNAPATVTANCFQCNGTGEMCDICGEASNVCEGLHDDGEEDDDDS